MPHLGFGRPPDRSPPMQRARQEKPETQFAPAAASTVAR